VLSVEGNADRCIRVIRNRSHRRARLPYASVARRSADYRMVVERMSRSWLENARIAPAIPAMAETGADVRAGVRRGRGFAQQSGHTAVLESLGLAGWAYHAKNEYIEIDSIAPRLYLAARLLQELGTRGVP
jgi:hypothetical protein